MAAQYGRTRAVAVLLGAAAAVHDDDDAPLRLAARNGHLLVVEQLLAAGASVDAKDGYSRGADPNFVERFQYKPREPVVATGGH